MLESQTVEAIYENGVLRPLKPLEGLVEHCRVKITIEREETTPHPLLQFAGILSDDEAAELRCMIDDEFEKIDPHAW
jgi:predicted DNA-binding antitoxin AbrB/MazE fold protein